MGLHWQDVRKLPVVGRAADWGMGPRTASTRTTHAAARVKGLKATESVCPYCAVGCGQVVYTRGGELVGIEGNPTRRSTRARSAPRAPPRASSSSSPAA